MKSVEFRNDPMFLRNQFARDGTFEMPIIRKAKLDLDNIAFIGYDKNRSYRIFPDGSYEVKTFEQEGAVLK